MSENQYFDCFMSTRPCDRNEGHDALSSCYSFAALEPPKIVVWADSPLTMIQAGAVAAYQLETGYQRVRPTELIQDVPARPALELADKIIDRIKPPRREGDVAIAHKLLGDTLYYKIDRAIQSKLPSLVKASNECRWNTNWATATDKTAALAARNPLADSVYRTALMTSVGRCYGGPGALRDAAIYESAGGPEAPASLVQTLHSWLALNTCWIYPHKDFAIISDRPQSITAEQVVYRDGWTVAVRPYR